MNKKPHREFGWPRSASNRAREFLFETLQEEPQTSSDVNKKWVVLDGDRKTLRRVKRKMIEDGVLEVVLESNNQQTLRLIAPTAPPADVQAQFTQIFQWEEQLSVYRQTLGQNPGTKTLGQKGFVPSKR